MDLSPRTQQLLSYTVFMVGLTNTFLFCLINNFATYGVLWNVKMSYTMAIQQFMVLVNSKERTMRQDSKG